MRTEGRGSWRSRQPAQAVSIAWWARALFGAVGAGALAIGAVGAFTSDNGAGIAALIAVGGALLVVAGLGDVVSFTAGGVSIDRSHLVADVHKQEAEDRARVGDAAGARQQWREALRHIDPIDDLSRAYEAIRRHVPPGSHRTSMFRELAEATYRLDAESLPDFVAAQEGLNAASDGERFVILALLRSDPASARPEAIIDAIGSSRSAHEQYLALRVADAACPSWAEPYRARLVDVVRTQLGPSGWIKSGMSRHAVAEQILQKAAAPR